MRKIGIIGYGALGRQIENLVTEEEGKEGFEIYYFDDIFYEQGGNNCFRFCEYNDSKFKDLEFYIGLGYKHLDQRKKIGEQLVKNNFKLPSFIHKTSYISPSAAIAQGVIIYPMCNIDQMVSVELGVIANNSVTISHDTVIGSATFIAPGVTIGGNCKIGISSFLGIGSVIANDIRIGNNVIIGIGSNITKNIGDNCSVIGNPFKVLKNGLNL